MRPYSNFDRCTRHKYYITISCKSQKDPLTYALAPPLVPPSTNITDSLYVAMYQNDGGKKKSNDDEDESAKKKPDYNHLMNRMTWP